MATKRPGTAKAAASASAKLPDIGPSQSSKRLPGASSSAAVPQSAKPQQSEFKGSDTLVEEGKVPRSRVDQIIDTFKRKRYDGLSYEDLAIAITYKDFSLIFKKKDEELKKALKDAAAAAASAATNAASAAAAAAANVKPAEASNEAECLLKLFSNVEKYGPPGFLQRLRDADASHNQNGKLNRIELALFCERAKLSKDETEMLIKVADLKPGDLLTNGAKKNGGEDKTEIDIFKFMERCEDNPAVDAVFLQRVMHKFARETVHVRRLTYEQLFERLDTNDDKSITAEDLRVGFASMGFALSDRDYKKVWQRFDKDGSGAISSEELKQVLAAYESMQPTHTQITFEERLGRPKFDSSVGQPSEDVKALDGTLLFA